jgi:hypothetical protein
MEKQSIRVEKTLVKSCSVCGLSRIPRSTQYHDENYKGEPGVKITTTDDVLDKWSSDPREHTSSVCQICVDNVIHLHNVMVANKLTAGNKADVRYVYTPSGDERICPHCSKLTENEGDICGYCEKPLGGEVVE